MLKTREEAEVSRRQTVLKAHKEADERVFLSFFLSFFLSLSLSLFLSVNIYFEFSKPMNSVWRLFDKFGWWFSRMEC